MASTTTYLKDYTAYPFKLTSASLAFDLMEGKTTVRSILSFYRPDANEAPLVLDGVGLDLISLSIDREPLCESHYTQTDTGLIIPNVPNKFSLEIEVVICPEQNKALMGLYQSSGNYCTQCESHGFRRITYFPDRPDVMTRFTVSMTADKAQFPYLLSNGNLVEEKDLGGGIHYAKWVDPSLKPCYLFALVAGDFDLIEDTFVTMEERSVALKLFLEKGFKSQGHYAMQALKRAMHWDETVYGLAYDLDTFMTVAVSDFNFGAMENKGLNVFNTKYILAKPETATDRDYLAIEAVVGHEYFHNWSGDRVTCRDWFQITLKEGLTVFRDQSFTADMTSAAVQRIDAVNIIRNVQFLEDAGPMAHPIQPQSYIEMNNFYTVTVYNKGAEIIRMIQTLLGKKTFFEAMTLYFSRHDGQAVTTEDFIRCMEDASGKELTQFRRWYVQAGTPTVTVTDHYDADAEAYTLKVKQHTSPSADGSPKENFHIPLAMGMLSASGETMPLYLKGDRVSEESTMVLNITEAEQTFTFLSVKEKPLPSLLRYFSAPVTLHYNYSDSDLMFLMQHDSDAFNRWDAAQALFKRLLLAQVERFKSDQACSVPSAFVDAFKYVLENEVDCELAALSLTLPSEKYLTQFSNEIDAIHAAREGVRLALSLALSDVLYDTYTRLHDSAPYTYDNQSVGKRRLKNTCLAYLLMQEKHSDLAVQQFEGADNMTDKWQALIALNQQAGSARDTALKNFYSTYACEPLVIDKWFAVQASASFPDTLACVKALLAHAAYQPKNPNSVRALVGSFAQNLSCFHQADGSGYAFVAEQVVLVDQFNGMLAARLVAPLTQFQWFDLPRQVLMKEALNNIIAQANCSADVKEVVEKALANG